MNGEAKQGVFLRQDNWMNLTPGGIPVVAGQQVTAGAHVAEFNQAVCYVHFVLGGIIGGGYLQFSFEFGPDNTNWYAEEAIRAIGTGGLLATEGIYRRLTVSLDRRIAVPILDDWMRITKTAVHGGGDFLTTEFQVSLRAG